MTHLFHVGAFPHFRRLVRTWFTTSRNWSSIFNYVRKVTSFGSSGESFHASTRPRFALCSISTRCKNVTSLHMFASSITGSYCSIVIKFIFSFSVVFKYLQAIELFFLPWLASLRIFLFIVAVSFVCLFWGLLLLVVFVWVFRFLCWVCCFQTIWLRVHLRDAWLNPWLFCVHILIDFEWCWDCWFPVEEVWFVIWVFLIPRHVISCLFWVCFIFFGDPHFRVKDWWFWFRFIDWLW